MVGAIAFILSGQSTLAIEKQILQDIPDVVVIANPSVKESTISLKKLRTIFAMKSRFWEENDPVTVFVLSKDHPVHAQFCKKILNIFPAQLESIWYRQVFTGTGIAPKELVSEVELINLVKQTPGAIAYINNKNEELKRYRHEIKLLSIQD